MIWRSLEEVDEVVGMGATEVEVEEAMVLGEATEITTIVAGTPTEGIRGMAVGGTSIEVVHLQETHHTNSIRHLVTPTKDHHLLHILRSRGRQGRDTHHHTLLKIKGSHIHHRRHMAVHHQLILTRILLAAVDRLVEEGTTTLVATRIIITEEGMDPVIILRDITIQADMDRPLLRMDILSLAGVATMVATTMAVVMALRTIVPGLNLMAEVTAEIEVGDEGGGIDLLHAEFFLL